MAKKGSRQKELAFPERDLTEIAPADKVDPRSFLMRTWRRFVPEPPLKASHQSVTIFTRQFAVLLQAGVPMVKAFDSFHDPEEPLHKAVALVGQKVEAGNRLSAAMRGFPHIFSPIYCGLVESGEKTGQLVEVLNKLSNDMEKQLKMRKKLTAAMTYPAILLIAAIVCVTFFVTSVLPLLEPMFTSMHVQLPFATRVLLHMREVVQVGFVVGSISGVCCYFLYKAISKNPLHRRWLDRLLLYFPLVGPLYKSMTITRILQSLATMLDVGMTLVHAIQSCEGLTSNYHIAYQLGEIRRSVIDGHTVGESMSSIPLFPRATLILISVGEESSNLIEMCKFSAKILEEDFDIAVDQVAANLEPFIMLIMGVVVGFIVLGAMLPIVQLLQNL